MKKVDPPEDPSRREFLAVSGAVAMHSVAQVYPIARTLERANGHDEREAIPPPLQITGGVKPLFKGQTARPLRYTPVAKDFVIRNGGEFFNRPLYGQNNDFRVDVGDRPEFSVYLPGHGGNLKFGISTPIGRKWVANSNEVVTRYRPGRMVYEIKDRILGAGSLRIEVITARSGVLVKLEAPGAPNPTVLTWAYAGADGRKGGRSGDIGCESVPVSQYFQVRPEDCAGNLYTMQTIGASNGGARPASRLHAPAGALLLAFPVGSVLGLAEFPAWTASEPVTRPTVPEVAPHLPILTGSVELRGTPVHLAVWRDGPGDGSGYGGPRSRVRASQRGRFRL